MAMNYKGVRFRTEFVSGINIEKFSKSLGILPTGVKPNGVPHYTLPAILDRTSPTDPVALSDSFPILEYLDKTYPSPGRVLFPAETQALYQSLILKIIYFMPYLAARAHLAAKADEDRDEFRGRLERLFGKPVEEIEKQGAEREVAYNKLEGIFEQLGDAMVDAGESFLLTGGRMIAADFAVAGCIMFIKCLSVDDVYVKLRWWHAGRWARFFDAFEPYMALNNP
jgi:glutathione S-transferase